MAVRAELVARATALRAEGLIWREVADRLGVSLAYANGLATDPDYAKRNARRRRPEGVCETCGGDLGPRPSRGMRRFCTECAAQRNRDRAARRWTAGKDAYNERRRVIPEIRAANREANRRWYANNRDKARAARVAADDRAPMPRATPEEVLAFLWDPCVYCGGPAGYGIDHIVPLAAGGSGDWTNLAACCFSCNRRKRDTPLLIFLAKERGVPVG